MKKIISKIWWGMIGIVLTEPVFAVEGESALKNPLKTGSIPELVKSIAELATQIGLPIAAIFIIYSGIKFVTARGNEEQLKEARKTFYWTIIGAGILLGAWVIAKAIVGTIEGLK